VKDNPQAFRSEWIRLMRLKPNKLAAMRASGESMEPTIHDGDSLLMDTGANQRAGRQGLCPLVRRRRAREAPVPATWWRPADRLGQPGTTTIEVGPDYPEHVRIIGRVVHRSGVGGL
jgi:hypothetical protein